ncbi:hypothetical protein ABPG74_002176 [Tetrahymena malaccensis]
MNKNSQNKLYLAQNTLPLQVSNIFKRHGSKQAICQQEQSNLKQGDDVQNLLINNQHLKKKNNTYKLQLNKLIKCEQPLLNLDYSPKQDQNANQRQSLQKDTKNKYFYQTPIQRRGDKMAGISKSHSVKMLVQNQQIPSSQDIQRINSQQLQQQQVIIPSLEMLVDQSSSVFSKNTKDKEESIAKQFYSPKVQKNSKIQINLPSNQTLQLNDFRNFLREQIFQQQSKQHQSQNNSKYLTDFFSSKQFKLQKNQKTQEQDQQSFSVQTKYENKSTKNFKQSLNHQNIFSQSCKQRSFTNNFTQTNYCNNDQEFNIYSEEQKSTINSKDSNKNNVVQIKEDQQKERNDKYFTIDMHNQANQNNKQVQKHQKYQQQINLLCNLNQIKNENTIQKFNKKNSTSLNFKHIILNERIQHKLVSPSLSVQPIKKKNNNELKNSSDFISQIILKQKQDHLTNKLQTQQESIISSNFAEHQQKVQNNPNEIKVKKIANLSKNTYSYSFRNYKFKQEHLTLPSSAFNSPKIKKNFQQCKSDDQEIRPWDYYSIQENMFDSYNNLIEINKQDLQTDIKNEPS